MKKWTLVQNAHEYSYNVWSPGTGNTDPDRVQGQSPMGIPWGEAFSINDIDNQASIRLWNEENNKYASQMLMSIHIIFGVQQGQSFLDAESF